MKRALLTAVLGLALGLAACSSSSSQSWSDAPEAPSRGGEGDTVRSALTRNMSPAPSSAERETFARDRADFAVRLYRAAAEGGGNVFLSPHSVSVALAMVYAGARGDTAAEMKDALHFGLPDDRLHEAFNAIDLALASRGKDAKGKDGKAFQLAIANSTWGQKGTTFFDPFLDTLAVSYGAGLELVDFEFDREAARMRINGWVADRTAQRIPELLTSGVLRPDTRFVLVNAAYMSAAWETSFVQDATIPATFTKQDGTAMQVPMMRGSAVRRHRADAGYEAVEMPYDGEELSMLAIVPSSGTFGAFESSLTGARVLDILAGLEHAEVDLSFPKLALDGSFDLVPPLKSLGMKQAFVDGGADFRGIGPWRPWITNVIHQTFLDVDESGTEAAAATAVVVSPASGGAPPRIVRMVVDRPFILAIVDRETKTLLFLGRVLEPKAL